MLPGSLLSKSLRVSVAQDRDLRNTSIDKREGALDSSDLFCSKMQAESLNLKVLDIPFSSVLV